jgi:hypothetical protein
MPISGSIDSSYFEITKPPDYIYFWDFTFMLSGTMKPYHLLLLLALIALPSCAPNPNTTGPITIVQLKSLDFNSIRPRLVTLLGKDSSGLEALSMITTYEDFLLDNYPIDTSYEKVPKKDPLDDWRRWSVGIIDPERQQKLQPIIKQPASIKLFLQILHQNLINWMSKLDKFHSEFIYTDDIRDAKKGAAAGYNALISGPSVNDIPKITDKMQQLIDSMYARDKTLPKVN